jgi:hypothetical protein
MGLIYIFGALMLFIVLGMALNQLRLRRLRRERQSNGFSREEFIGAFRQLGIPDNMPTAVYDYYCSLEAWKNFPFSSNDTYPEVLRQAPEDMQNDRIAIVDRVGLQLAPEYIRREWGEKPIETLRDMVLGLDWVRQHQPTTEDKNRSGEATENS